LFPRKVLNSHAFLNGGGAALLGKAFAVVKEVLLMTAFWERWE